jgi:hypothetical protein
MAVAPNSVVTPQAINTSAHVVAAGDQTAPALLKAASTNGDIIYKVLVYPGAGNREFGLYLYDGANSRQIALIDIILDATADVIPIDVLANLPLPLDSNGNKVLYLAPSYSLYCSMEDVAQTNDVIIISQSL